MELGDSPAPLTYCEPDPQPQAWAGRSLGWVSTASLPATARGTGTQCAHTLQTTQCSLGCSLRTHRGSGLPTP